MRSDPRFLSGVAGILNGPLGRTGAASVHSQTPSKQGRGGSRFLGEDHNHVGFNAVELWAIA